MTISIPLTHGYVAIVDDVDTDLAAFKWKEAKDGYVYHNAKVDGKWIHVKLHRVVLARKLGRELLSTELGDHQDTNKLNCQRYNLRLATPAQNSSNRSLNKNNISGYKGVRPARVTRNKNSWFAQISLKGVTKHIGTFDNVIDAHRAYCRAALIHYGDFANFGEGSPFTGWTLDDFEATK